MIQHFLSIIICTRNRANELNTSLELVVQQAQEFDDVEVLVVDNGSTDNTKIVVKNISKKFNFSVHYIWEPTIGLSQARNRGRAESQGKVLAYIDDDVRLKNGWIAQVRQHFIEKRSDCLGGKVSVCLEGEVPFKSIEGMREFFGELDYGNEIREFQETDWLSNPMGCNMAFTTAVFDSVGGFQTAFKLYGDETDFFQRIKQKDLTILYVPKAEVEQNIPVERLTKKELRYKSYLHGKGFAIPWLLSSPGFIRRFLKIGWYSIKVLGHGVFYLYNPTFYRFFILWFYWGNIVQFIEGLGKKA